MNNRFLNNRLINNRRLINSRLMFPRLTLVAIIIIAVFLLIRLYLLLALPLYDTTEARYAEIARIMFETNNWVTPQFDYQQPFWGKPPLHTWMSAASFSTLGVSAFTARLPHFICGLLVLVLVYTFARDIKNTASAILSCLVLTSSLGFIIAMGMVMTDIALLLGITVGMISFWKAYAFSEKSRHGHLFFASLAFGMLVKGPVAIVIVGIALFSWSLWQRTIKQALGCLPWLSGILLFLSITLPWYLLAEHRTPGFLEYFILGEHFQRFMVSGWEGDLYGSAHDKPRGTIWLYWLIAACPWSFLLIGKLATVFTAQSTLKQRLINPNTITPYLVCWILSPMLLFTLAGNILMSYVLPGFTALALLLGIHSQLSRTMLLLASVSLAFVALLPVAKHSGWISKTSEIELLGNMPEQYTDAPLYYWNKRPFSARFYSNGKARFIDDDKKLTMLAYASDGFYLAIKPDDYIALDSQLSISCIEQKRTKDRLLLFCRGKQ